MAIVCGEGDYTGLSVGPGYIPLAAIRGVGGSVARGGGIAEIAASVC